MGQLLNLELTHPEFRSTAVSLDPFCRTSCCQPQRGLSTGRIGVQPEGTQQNERPFVYYCPSRTQPAIITVHQLWWKRQESRDGIDWKNWRIFLWRTEWRTEFFNSHVVTAVSYGLDTRCVFQLDGPVDNQEDAVEFLQSAANRFRDCLLDSLAVVDAPSSVSYGHVQVQLFSDWNSCPLPSLPYCEAYRLCHDKFSSLQSANPLTVWLCPVKKKIPAATTTVCRVISPGSIDGCLDFFLRFSGIQLASILVRREQQEGDRIFIVFSGARGLILKVQNLPLSYRVPIEQSSNICRLRN